MSATRLACCIVATLALVGTEAASSPAPAVTVRVALVQMTAVDGDLSGNLAKMDSYAAQAATAGAKICVFPEWCDLGHKGISLVQPIPGSTTAAIGSMAKNHGLWIVAAIWEKAPGGAFDTLVIFNDRGELLMKQRKLGVGGKFDGGPAYNGTYQDAQLVPSPWGALGGIICADMYGQQNRKLLADLKPALMFAVLSNPPADLPAYVNSLAPECGCPAVCVNMVWPGGIQGGSGGRSQVVSETGTTLWQAGNTTEVFKTWDLTLNPGNLPPAVDAGDVQTIRLPTSQVTLTGYATDDGLPSGTLTTTWSKLSGPGTVTFGNTGALSTTAAFSTSGIYVLRLTASDGALTRTDDVSVNVLPATGDLNLVGYWPFDGTAADQSGLGNNGTLVAGTGGTPVYSTDHAPTGGTNSRSLDVTLSKGSVQVPHTASLNATQAATMSLWIKPRVSFPGNVLNGGNSWAQFVRKGDTWGQSNYLFGFGAYYPAYAEGVGCGRVGYLDLAVLTPGVWYHVAAVLDSNKNQGKVYLNGTLEQTVFFGERAPAVNTDPLRIGYNGVDCLIDDVRLYTRVLSNAEIAALAPGSVVNKAPVVNAGLDLSVTLPAGVTLQGSYTDDVVPASSATCSFTSWRKVSGPGDVHFANVFAPSTSATFTMAGVYVLELVGSDGSNRRADTVRVTVNSSPTLPTVTATATDAAASETGPDPGKITFTRSGSTTAALTVLYSVSGTATAGLDYATLSGSVTIPAGAVSATVTITPIDDTLIEAAETVTLTVSSNAAYLVGSPASGTVTIADNDTATSGDIMLNGQVYTTIQAAVNAGSPGDTVLLGPKTFPVPAGIALKGGVSIRGTAPQQTILDGKGAAVVVHLIGTMADGKSVLELLTVANGGVGIDTGAANVLLRNLQVVKLAGDGIIVGANGSVEGVSLTVADNGGTGVSSATATPASFRGTIVIGNTGYGVSGPAQLSFSYSTLYRNALGSSSGAVSFGPGILAADIGFTNPVALDYREVPGGVNVDSGDVADPYTLEPAPNGSRINQGAFGNTPYATTTPSLGGGGSGSSGHGSGGGGCGATGLEVLLLLALRLAGRRRS